MTYQIEIQNEAAYPVDLALLQQAALIALTQQTAQPDSSLTLVITDDQAITALNRQYRGVDSPTDVLSFPADQPQLFDNDSPYLGDIITAYPYAVQQAQREGHAVDDSLALLVVHGVLHLLGFDHDTVENRAAMWQAQAAVLNALGILPAIVPALESELHE